MAAAYSEHSAVGTPYRAVLSDRLDEISAASRRESTPLTQERAEQQLIDPDQTDQGHARQTEKPSDGDFD